MEIKVHCGYCGKLYPIEVTKEEIKDEYALYAGQLFCSDECKFGDIRKKMISLEKRIKALEHNSYPNKEELKKLRREWSKAELKYFTKPIPTAERDYGWLPWLILAICSLTGLGYLVMGIIE